MTLFADIKQSFRPRCPSCQRGRLFRPWSVSVVDVCDSCGLPLGNHDIGDAASVFMIFLFGATCVPLAWVMELLWSPPMWFQALFWGVFMLCLIALILPAIKAYIMLLEFRHDKNKR